MIIIVIKHFEGLLSFSIRHFIGLLNWSVEHNAAGVFIHGPMGVGHISNKARCAPSLVSKHFFVHCSDGYLMMMQLDEYSGTCEISWIFSEIKLYQYQKLFFSQILILQI